VEVPSTAVPVDVEPVARSLDAAVRRHQAEVLAAAPAFRNQVLVVMSDLRPDGAAHLRDLAMAAEMLRAAGLRSRAAGTDDLLGADLSEGLARREERARCVVIPGGALCGLELERLPGRTVTLGWLHAVLTAAAPLDASIHLVPVTGTAAHRVVERRLRNLTADRLLDLDRGRVGDAAVDVGLEAAATLRDRLARNEVRPLRMSLTIAVRGVGEAEARRSAEIVRAAAAGSGLRLRHAHLRHSSVVRSTLPSGQDPGGGKLVDSSAAATCLPLTETVCDDASGYRLGLTRRAGAPVAVDVFDTAQHSNANIAVFATSGHGKSFTLGALVLESAAHGVGALVVDPEGEYQRRLLHAAGGQYLRLGSPGAGALSVFDAAPSPEEAVPVAVDLVNVLCGSVLTEVERARVDAALHEAVAAAGRERRAALLGDCLPPLERTAPRCATVLRRVCSGSLGAIFNRPSDIDLTGDLCAISLRDLPHEFVPAATLLIAQWLWTRVRRERRRRHIVLDEVGALCVPPPLRELLVQLARRCRKYGASLVVATQNEDLLRSEEGLVVATNCATVLLGGHRAAEAARMERAFGLTEGQRRFVEHACRGEFLLLAGRRRCEIRVDVPELHRSILAPG